MSDTFDPVQTRRDEVAAYDANIRIYRAILQQLPSEWPEDLLQYRKPGNAHTAIDNVPLERVAEISELWYADEIQHLIRTETLERTKAAAILAALEG